MSGMQVLVESLEVATMKEFFCFFYKQNQLDIKR
jgi:hypothetical protein